jgi:ABC-2 type transport system ATP-binding protein
VLAEGTPSSLKAADRGRLRLQVMLQPTAPTPPLPAFTASNVRVGHNLAVVIDDRDAAAAITWAQQLVDSGTAEEYALGATTLEDVYIRLTGRASLGAQAEGG